MRTHHPFKLPEGKEDRRLRVGFEKIRDPRSVVQGLHEDEAGALRAATCFEFVKGPRPQILRSPIRCLKEPLRPVFPRIIHERIETDEVFQ
jgi:hypothetical protein